jgi:hypothetical protein
MAIIDFFHAQIIVLLIENTGFTTIASLCQLLTVFVLLFPKGQFGLASWKCSEESFAHQVKIRDPLKLGSAPLFLPHHL